MRAAKKLISLFAAMTLFGAADAGHESPVYPSFYPQEIRIETVKPAAAARALKESRIQAYAGEVANLSAATDKTVRFVESLGAFLLVRVNPDSNRAHGADARCALARRTAATLAGVQSHGFRFHPYPVTPLHAGYLHHFDLAARAKARFRKASEGAAQDIRVRAVGPWAERIVGARHPPVDKVWDVSIEAIDLDRLVAPHRFAINGWMGPPWLKQGWFHAWLLLSPALEADNKAHAESLVARLKRGAYRDGVERINLERDLLKLLTGGCRAAVAGYGLRRWPYNADYSAGVENIAYDSHTGFRSAIFLRAVKLKDFPWNGWLTLGVPEAPKAAWNPLGGFTDKTGRLLWLALGDPALFPETYNAGWSLNRIGDVQETPR